MSDVCPASNSPGLESYATPNQGTTIPRMLWSKPHPACAEVVAMPIHAGRGHWSLLGSELFEPRLSSGWGSKSASCVGALEHSARVPVCTCVLFLSAPLRSLNSRILRVRTLNQLQKHSPPQKPTSRCCGSLHPVSAPKPPFLPPTQLLVLDCDLHFP